MAPGEEVFRAHSSLRACTTEAARAITPGFRAAGSRSQVLNSHIVGRGLFSSRSCIQDLCCAAELLRSSPASFSTSSASSMTSNTGFLANRFVLPQGEGAQAAACTHSVAVLILEGHFIHLAVQGLRQNAAQLGFASAGLTADENIDAFASGRQRMAQIGQDHA